jgi:hypothetical protein
MASLLMASQRQSVTTAAQGHKALRLSAKWSPLTFNGLAGPRRTPMSGWLVRCEQSEGLVITDKDYQMYDMKPYLPMLEEIRNRVFQHI